MIASIKLINDKFSLQDIIYNMSGQVILDKEIHIIEVTFKWFLEQKLDEEKIYIKKEIKINDLENKEIKIVLHYVEFFYFAKNILNFIPNKDAFISNDLSYYKDKKLYLSPIIIFRNGVSWSNIISLLQLEGITVHGGSNTRRHKLSINEYRLSVFLYLSGLIGSVEEFYANYIDKIISSNTFPKDLYNYLKFNDNLDSFEGKDKNLKEYLEFNKNLHSFILIQNYGEEMLSLEKEINTLTEFINIEYDSKLQTLLKFKSNLNKRLEKDLTKDFTYASQKHRMVVKARIKKLKGEKTDVDIDIKNLNSILQNNKEKLIKLNLMLTEIKDKKK